MRIYFAMVKTMGELDLKAIITQYPQSLDNPKMLKGLILDLYPQCPRGLVLVIISIAGDGIMQEIQNAGNYSDIMLSRWVTCLENNYGYSEKISKKAIELWSVALSDCAKCDFTEEFVDAVRKLCIVLHNISVAKDKNSDSVQGELLSADNAEKTGGAVQADDSSFCAELELFELLLSDTLGYNKYPVDYDFFRRYLSDKNSRKTYSKYALVHCVITEADEYGLRVAVPFVNRIARLKKDALMRDNYDVGAYSKKIGQTISVAIIKANPLTVSEKLYYRIYDEDKQANVIKENIEVAPPFDIRCAGHNKSGYVYGYYGTYEVYLPKKTCLKQNNYNGGCAGCKMRVKALKFIETRDKKIILAKRVR